MAGTQENLVTQAATKWKAAKADRDKCAKAQAGTPDGNRYQQTERDLASARGVVDSKHADYTRHMREHEQGSYIKPLSDFGVY